MSKTYIVTSGDYEDYTILAVFGSDQAAAAEFAAKDSDRQVEVYTNRSAGWDGETEAWARTWIGLESERFGNVGATERGESKQYGFGAAEEHTSRATRYSYWSVMVSTRGPVEGFEEAHNKAVEAARAAVLEDNPIKHGTINWGDIELPR